MDPLKKSNAEVLTLKTNGVGVVTLNAPARLNALTLKMLTTIDAFLRDCERDPKISVVLLEGAGERGFCAGGDVKKLALETRSQGITYGRHFFEVEYRCDHLVHLLKKPRLALCHGVTLGGGIGLMNGASHRVVCENTTMAMPEISIGLFPDVGGSYFLSRLPGRIGLFLGLTGARWNASDALAMGFADFAVATGSLTQLRERVLSEKWSGSPSNDTERLSRIVGEFSTPTAQLPLPQVLPRQATLDELCAGSTLYELDQRFRKELSRAENDPASDPWITHALKTYAAGSPHSAQVTFEQIKKGARLSLAQCFEMELELSTLCMGHPDFFEGVRARLIDKDGTPKWAASDRG